MAREIIGIGTTANDGTGDPLRTAFDKVNDNFEDLYRLSPGLNQAASRLVIDSFTGSLRSNVSSQNAGNTAFAVNGGVTMTTSTTTNARTSLRLADGNLNVNPTAGFVLRYSTNFSIPVLPDGTETFIFFFGPNSTFGIPTTHMAGFYLRWTGSAVAFEAVTRAAGTQDTTVLTTPAVNTNYVLDIVITGTTDAKYYVDGVLVATHTNLPTSNMSLFAHLIKSAGTTARTASLRYFVFEVAP